MKQRMTVQMVRECFSYEGETGEFVWQITNSNRAVRGSAAGNLARNGYLTIFCNGFRYAAHRLAWLHVYGEWPSADIDHINGIRTDNRISNLRSVTGDVNQQNRQRAMKNSKTGVLGVTKAGNRFKAQLAAPKGGNKSLGLFKTIEEAQQTYLNAKRLTHAGCTI